MNCVFCGAVKNCGRYLKKVFRNLEQLGSLFDNYAIVLYLDKSVDNSHELLVKYGKMNPQLMFYYNPNPVSEYRTHRIANARNECIKIVYSKFANYPYFIMMDFDDVCSEPVKVDVLKKYLHEDTWDALSFNKNPYYDIWALSIHPFVISCFHMQKINQNERVNQRDKKIEAQRYITKILAESDNLVPCLSAFNGFAIYRTSKFVNCYYDGKFRLDLLPQNYLKMTLNATKNELKFQKYDVGNKYEDCEHRSFHIMAKNENGARIMIAPEILFD
jgi:hypothetical protein